jgi:nickel-dependent lactate racemase
VSVNDAWVYSGAQTLPVPAPCDFLPPARLEPLADVPSALAASLATPCGAPRLRSLARGVRDAVVVIPDLSRACPNGLIVPALLDELNAAGIPDECICVLVGCGLHRSTTATEKRRLVGEAAARRVRVMDSQGLESEFADLGTTLYGFPLRLHAAVAEAGIVVGVGILEPHLYAGFSAGLKSVGIGCAAEPTIGWTHRPAFISQAGVELCRLEGNPFQEALRDLTASVNFPFAVNVVADDHGRVAGLAAGDPATVQRTLADQFRPGWLKLVDEPYDVIVAGIKAPKHENLYQASRAATYVAFAARPALAPGGLMLLCADLPLGPGDGPGEINFAKLLAADADDPSRLVERGLREPLGPGGQRAFVVARVLRRFRVGVCGTADAGFLTSLGMPRYASVAEGLADARSSLGRAPRVLAVADALTTIVRCS